MLFAAAQLSKLCLDKLQICFTPALLLKQIANLFYICIIVETNCNFVLHLYYFILVLTDSVVPKYDSGPTMLTAQAQIKHQSDISLYKAWPAPL